jgi:hypothetical protein
VHFFACVHYCVIVIGANALNNTPNIPCSYLFMEENNCKDLLQFKARIPYWLSEIVAS